MSFTAARLGYGAIESDDYGNPIGFQASALGITERLLPVEDGSYFEDEP